VKDTAETKPKICHSDNPTGQNPDLKAKITSKIESKNVFAFLKLFRFRVQFFGARERGREIKPTYHNSRCLGSEIEW